MIDLHPMACLSFLPCVSCRLTCCLPCCTVAPLALPLAGFSFALCSSGLPPTLLLLAALNLPLLAWLLSMHLDGWCCCYSTCTSS
ncbi:uncharacterized protein BJ171DRAFT_320079 [Polychytrium aggregatum]|uniref:uncharacterized protein n=1 Tax=Polychytrium aggregatum TaxID=110093 RepID=UPI0022FDEA82|nr:uncharacterized protein BJ171DRAFT_320079 [Polychytrium aggregatum]KAI9193049.1 hypothetical protein BJ171DRAFT_320079 [Polychytrium aggregatum]